MGAERIENVNAPEFIARLRGLAPDIVLVVSFGQILRDELLNLPEYGCVNVHASLLPKYRGASPIAAAIANRDAMTGIAYMRMNRGLDTGDVFRILPLELRGNESADALEFQLGLLAAGELETTLCGIVDGTYPPRAQEEAAASKTKKIKKSDGLIDWRRSAADIEALLRAYHPWPGAHFNLLLEEGPLTITVRRANVLSLDGGRPGEILLADPKRGWIVACGEGALELLEIVPTGRKAMPATAFLNGCRLDRAEVMVE